MFYKVGFFVLLGVALFIAGSQAKTFFPTTSPTPTPSITPEVTPEIVTTISPTATPAINDTESIRKAMALKYGKQPSDVELEVSQKTAMHAWGVTKFKGEMGGGWFLAYKGSGGWIIVDDGNGTISCEKIAPYNFPVSMVEACVDANGKLLQR